MLTAFSASKMIYIVSGMALNSTYSPLSFISAKANDWNTVVRMSFVRLVCGARNKEFQMDYFID